MKKELNAKETFTQVDDLIKYGKTLQSSISDILEICKRQGCDEKVKAQALHEARLKIQPFVDEFYNDTMVVRSEVTDLQIQKALKKPKSIWFVRVWMKIVKAIRFLISGF